MEMYIGCSGRKMLCTDSACCSSPVDVDVDVGVDVDVAVDEMVGRCICRCRCRVDVDAAGKVEAKSDVNV
jgi:hypothetical protein